MPITSPSARAKTSSIVLPSWDGSTLLTLRVTGTGNAGKYSLDDGVLKVQTDVTASVNILTEIPNKTVSFEYNAQGLRTKKTVTLLGKVTETEYILHGKLVTEMVVRKYDAATPTQITEENVLHFFYDAQSRPAKVEYDGEMYSYLHNLQGDIVGIVDGSGEVVVQYSYDAWGGGEVTLDSILEDGLRKYNPFRYRGYVYDLETELYYLRSRFFNFIDGLFINVDILIGEVGTLLSHNGWTYCKCNAIMLKDINGTEPSLFGIPIDHYKSDWVGRIILAWYLFGKGKKREVTYASWGEYMKRAMTCTCDFCQGEKRMSLKEFTFNAIKQVSQGIQENETREIDITTNVAIENGEHIFGYNYLHGVNNEKGGFRITGTVTRYCGYVSYEVTCTWNDMIDPNLTYTTDRQKAEFAQRIPFAAPMDYEISITWNDSFVENMGGVSVPSY